MDIKSIASKVKNIEDCPYLQSKLTFEKSIGLDDELPVPNLAPMTKNPFSIMYQNG